VFKLSNVPSSFRWAAAIIVVFPLSSVVLGEVILRLKRARHALAAPLGAIRSVVMPALVILIVMLEVVGWDRQSISVRLVETVLCLVIVHTSLSFLNGILFVGAKEDSWQAKFPHLFVDLIRVLVVLVAAAIALSTIWGQDLAQLVEALGVGTICIGLALQQPLGNLFSGIFLMIERPVSVGDWIKFESGLGKVVQTNWRAIHLQTRDGNLIVIPNGSLAKGMFTNFSRPARQYRKTVGFGFSYDDPPNKVKMVLKETALRTPGVLAYPAPHVHLADFADSYNLYNVKISMDDFGNALDILDEFRTRVWYASERHGLNMPYPTQVHISETEQAERPLSTQVIEAFPRFDLRDRGSPDSGGPRSTVKLYAKGEQVVREGERLAGIHLILEGTAKLTASDGTGKDASIATLGRGEFFGEKTLVSGQLSDVTVTVLDDLEVLVLQASALHSIIDRTPHLAREIAQVMESRRNAVSSLRANLSSQPDSSEA
jgi:small-conductance mechanosensitive channel